MSKEQLTLVPPPERRVVTIPVADIQHDETAIPPASLIGSMMKHGLLQPIVVIRTGMGWKVADGRRRLAAARHLGWPEIDAVEYQEGEVNPATVGLSANSLRTPNQVSEFAMLSDQFASGMSEQEITTETGMSAATIRKRMQLGELIWPAFEAAREGRIAPGIAEEMAKLPKAVQKQIMDGHTEGRITGPMVREAREVTRQQGWATTGFPAMIAPLPPPSWRQVAESHLEAALSVVPLDDPQRGSIDMGMALLTDLVRGESDADRRGT